MADVTIKLTGSQYRILTRELEYHQQTVDAIYKGMDRSNPDKRAAIARSSELAGIREVIGKVIDLHDQVRLKDPPEAYVGVIGTVVHVFTSDYANMTDRDVSVLWSNGQRTSECNANLEKVP